LAKVKLVRISVFPKKTQNIYLNECTNPSLPHHLHNHPFSSLPIKFAIENLLPGPEVNKF